MMIGALLSHRIPETGGGKGGIMTRYDRVKKKAALLGKQGHSLIKDLGHAKKKVFLVKLNRRDINFD